MFILRYRYLGIIVQIVSKIHNYYVGTGQENNDAFWESQMSEYWIM